MNRLPVKDGTKSISVKGERNKETVKKMAILRGDGCAEWTGMWKTNRKNSRRVQNDRGLLR